MIKSLDKQFDNTYRILRVLANHDYLATDLQQSKYIFSQSRITIHQHPQHQEHHNNLPKQYRYLLKHREIIEIDHIQYAVFAIGNNQALWAAHLQKKIIQNETYLYKIIKHSLDNILKELIWMGASQAKKYLDIRNFWVINDCIYFLLLPRIKKVNYSIKKSQKGITNYQKSIDSIIESEKALMKQFGLILWQICYQNSYFDDKNPTHSQQTQQILKIMINKDLSFEQLLNVVNKRHQQKLKQSRNVRYRTISHYDIFQRRKTQSSLEKSDKSNKSSQVNFAASRIIQQSKTQSFTKRPVIILKNRVISKEQPYSESKNKKTVYSRRQMSEQNTISISKRQKQFKSKDTKCLGSRLSTYTSTKDAMKYENWLNNKKYSQQIRQKLIKNGEIARRKFKETIENGKEQKEIQNFQDASFKEKILSRVIRFKNAFKQKQSYNQSIHSQEQNQRSQQNNSMNQKQSLQTTQDVKKTIEFIQPKQTNAQNETNLKQKNVLYSNEQQIYPKQNELINQTVKKQPKQPKKIQFIEQKINNQYILQQQKKDLNSHKTQKKRLKKSDIFDDAGQQDLQLIKLQPTKNLQSIIHNPTTFKYNQIPLKMNSYNMIEKINQNQLLHKKQQEDKQQIKNKTQIVNGKVLPSQAVNQFILLINTLGDTTVRAVKNKEKLKDFNWRLITYFLYERFQLQRKKITPSLSSTNKIVCRKHRKIDNNEWKSFMKNQQKQNLIVQINKQNQQITATLSRLALKLIQEQPLQNKTEYFIKNRQKLLKNDKLRAQLSRLLMSNIIDEFNYFLQQRPQNQEAIVFMTDCIYSMYVVAQLDALIPQNKYIYLDDYKEYGKDIQTMKSMVDYIDKAYFPKDQQNRQTV